MRNLKYTRDTEYGPFVVVGAVAAAIAVGATVGNIIYNKRRAGALSDDYAEADMLSLVREALGEHGLYKDTVHVKQAATGVVELRGEVETQEEARAIRRAVEGVEGVRTVVDRLDRAADEKRFRENQERLRQGDPRLTEAQWTGKGVGMGKRRQSPDTDPSRPSDYNDILDSELGTDRELEQNAGGFESDNAVTDHSTQPLHISKAETKVPGHLEDQDYVSERETPPMPVEDRIEEAEAELGRS